MGLVVVKGKGKLERVMSERKRKKVSGEGRDAVGDDLTCVLKVY